MPSTARQTKYAADRNGPICLLLDVRGQAREHSLQVWSYGKRRVVSIPRKVIRIETPDNQRWLAVTVPRRVPVLPQVPTMAEAGYPAVETTVWNGVLVPAKTPKTIVDRLNAEIVAVLRKPEVRERFAAQGAEAIGSTSAEFAAHIKREIAKWGKVVRAANLTVN